MIFKKLNNMRKGTAAAIAVLLLAVSVGDVYYTHRAEIKAMQDKGAAALMAAVDTELYREPEKTQIIEILTDTESAIRESENQAEIDALIEEAVSDTAGFKTDAVYGAEEDGISRLSAAVDVELYREAEQEEIRKILESTEAAIRETEDQAEIDALVEKAASSFAGFRTDAEYTAEEEAAAAAAAAAAEAERQRSQQKKASGSRGCVGTGADVFN